MAGMLSSWKEVVTHLPDPYDTDDIIVERGIETENCKEPPDMMKKQSSETLSSKVSRCKQLCTEHTLSGILVEG